MLINDAGGAIDSTEEDDDTESTGDTGQNDGYKDPLDAIEDETARNLAKAERAKAQRKAKETKVETDAADTSNYATKDDLDKRDAQRATVVAKSLVAPEVKELWDELTKVPLGGFDPMDPESIVKNMEKRYKLYQLENPDTPDISKDFQTSNVTNAAGAGKPTSKAEPVSLPGYKEPTPPSDWYPTK